VQLDYQNLILVPEQLIGAFHFLEETNSFNTLILFLKPNGIMFLNILKNLIADDAEKEILKL